MMPPMDKPMDSKPPMPMEKKDCSMECPACGAKLNVEKAPDMEKPMDKPMAKPPMPGMDRADKMPMDKLKNVLMSAKKPEPQGY